MIWVSVGASKQIERRLRQGEHLVAARGGHGGEEIHDRRYRGAAVSATSRLKRAPVRTKSCSCAGGAARGRVAAPPPARWPSWLPTTRERSHRAARARGSRPSSRGRGSGSVTRRRFSPRMRPSRPWVSSSRIGLANGRAVDAELPREIASRRAADRRPAASADDALLDHVGDLPIRGRIVERLEQIARLLRAACSALIPTPRTARGRSACGGSPRCRRRSHRAWRRAAAGRWGSR